MYSDFVSSLTDDSLLLLLNEAVVHLAISSGSAAGGASISLMLLMASQQELRVRRCLLSFKGQCLILSMKNNQSRFDHFCVNRNTYTTMNRKFKIT